MAILHLVSSSVQPSHTHTSLVTYLLAPVCTQATCLQHSFLLALPGSPVSHSFNRCSRHRYKHKQNNHPPSPPFPAPAPRARLARPVPSQPVHLVAASRATKRPVQQSIHKIQRTA